MILKTGEKIHVITRRNFEGDMRRHFIGEVIEASGSLARVAGYAFVLDNMTNHYIRRPDKRTRIISLADAVNIINLLPESADIELARYSQSKESKMIVTDGKSFALDINEFGLTR
jgi:hypothetical protein